MSYEQKSPHDIALEDFRRARRLAAAREILRRLKGQPINLLPFEEVRQHIKAQESHDRGLQRIPLDAIVGSVGRYAEFTRDFLPRGGSSRVRWARVKSAYKNLEDMPPIQVYQIGEVYFVLDGNHRVSIARERGATDIRAYVTEISSPIEITPETDLNSLILAAEHEAFLEHTRLNDQHPNLDLTITSPGRYKIIEGQIEQLQKQQKEHGTVISFPEAAQIWLEECYLPAREIIRAHDMLRDFPDRTETDLYVWISQHKEELQENLGWEIGPENAARDLTDQFSSRPDKITARLGERLRESIIPAPIEAGPKAGEWRKQQLSSQSYKYLFNNILVTISGETQNWQTLHQALIIARWEESNLLGLHVVAKEKQINTPETQQMRRNFNRICQESGTSGELAVDVGEITPTIIERARWSDLVVVQLAHPPSEEGLKRLAPGFHRLVQRCPRPMLVVPRYRPEINKLLLAYDGSPKADEALFIAAYLAGKQDLPLTVLIINEGDAFPQKAIARARWYMNTHRIIGDIHVRHGGVAETILETANGARFDLIIMGGYSHSPMLELVIGSAVDAVLRAAKCPILICR